ncbi:MtnX-like HAD-IB family phosphatase [Enterobacteriaceae bacterium LUAb1]
MTKFLPDSGDVISWAILCDFDGTISFRDVTDTLLMRFGQPGWDTLEQQWLSGEIGSQSCMSGQIALLDMTREDLDMCLADIAIDPDFKQFVAVAQRFGIPLSIVSDGLDYAIQRILKLNGLHNLPIIANHLKQISERRWQLSFPYKNRHCHKASGVCKCAVAQHTTSRVLLVGDGRSDFCVATQADYVLAKSSLTEECRRQNIPHTAFHNFSDATHILESLLISNQTEEYTCHSFNPLLPWKSYD